MFCSAISINQTSTQVIKQFASLNGLSKGPYCYIRPLDNVTDMQYSSYEKLDSDKQWSDWKIEPWQDIFYHKSRRCNQLKIYQHNFQVFAVRWLRVLKIHKTLRSFWFWAWRHPTKVCKWGIPHAWKHIFIKLILTFRRIRGFIILSMLCVDKPKFRSSLGIFRNLTFFNW